MNTERDQYQLWLSDPEGWHKAVVANADEGYGFTVIVASGLWMIAMQDAIADGKALEDVAKSTMSEINKGLGRWGLTGFQYEAVVSTVSQVWEYGEQLRHKIREARDD